MFSRSFSATKGRTCRTISAMNLPTREQGWRGCPKRHIENEDIRAYGFRYAAPFVYDHLVIAPQTVDGLYDEQIAGFEFADEAEIVGAVEIFAALFIAEDMPAVYIHGGKGFELS